LRRFLDRLYAASGALAALSLAGICALMLAQSAMREFGLLLRGADDIVGWLCAASAFLALGYTFRSGELVRVGVVLDRLAPKTRFPAEVIALGAALVFTAYLLYAVTGFVYESWKFNEVAQGLIKIPIWMPQMSLALGALILFIAVLDEFVALLRGKTPAYRAAEQAQRAHPEAAPPV
jgi:TRAP-type C4-dicarboxylate transport system permease small subunit